ncbi:hypothetical protein CUMW_213870 [Citrus unshiu]|uniref:Uncharacterized protein n=1 Tax=Citrus unshiu TaxID=55188 RepID=A0A2H5QBB6_CITUN|nr:hypothetical protein CUMW_213870 [Citrus unshiu]
MLLLLVPLIWHFSFKHNHNKRFDARRAFLRNVGFQRKDCWLKQMIGITCSRKSRFLSDNCTCQPQSDIYLLLLYALELVSFPGESLAIHCIEISTALAFAFTAFFVFEQQEIDGLAKSMFNYLKKSKASLIMYQLQLCHFLMTTRSNE